MLFFATFFVRCGCDLQPYVSSHASRSLAKTPCVADGLRRRTEYVRALYKVCALSSSRETGRMLKKKKKTRFAITSKDRFFPCRGGSLFAMSKNNGNRRNRRGYGGVFRGRRNGVRTEITKRNQTRSCVEPEKHYKPNVDAKNRKR